MVGHFDVIFYRHYKKVSAASTLLFTVGVMDGSSHTQDFEMVHITAVWRLTTKARVVLK